MSWKKFHIVLITITFTIKSHMKWLILEQNVIFFLVKLLKKPKAIDLENFQFSTKFENHILTQDLIFCEQGVELFQKVKKISLKCWMVWNFQTILYRWLAIPIKWHQTLKNKNPHYEWKKWVLQKSSYGHYQYSIQREMTIFRKIQSRISGWKFGDSH